MSEENLEAPPPPPAIQSEPVSSDEPAPPPPKMLSQSASAASLEDIPAPPPALPKADNVYSPPANAVDATPAAPPDIAAGLFTPDANSIQDPDNVPPPPDAPEETLLVQSIDDNDDESEEEVAGRDMGSPSEQLSLPVSTKGVPVLKEGWLKKKAGPLGISRKRYCVLYQNGILRYYTDDDKKKEHRKGKGDVSFSTIKQTTHDGKKFTVENENKVWQFEADDFVDAADWLAKFEIPGREQTQTRSSGYSMSTSMTLEAYGEDERMLAQKMHTL